MTVTLHERIQHQLLPRVSKPNRYIGNSLEASAKPLGSVDVRLLLAFPDAYEIGLSNLGIRILHHIVNGRAIPRSLALLEPRDPDLVLNRAALAASTALLLLAAWLLLRREERYL
mgnify:CR=1 FL=1